MPAPRRRRSARAPTVPPGTAAGERGATTGGLARGGAGDRLRAHQRERATVALDQDPERALLLHEVEQELRGDEALAPARALHLALVEADDVARGGGDLVGLGRVVLVPAEAVRLPGEARPLRQRRAEDPEAARTRELDARRQP